MSRLSSVGVALMVIAFAILAYFIIIPAILPIDTTPWLQGPYQSLFCHSGETLTSERDSYNPRPGETDTTVTSGCVDSEGNTRDISGSVITIGMVGYLAPFLIGLFMYTTGANWKRKQRVYNGGSNYQNDDFGTGRHGVHIASSDSVTDASEETLEKLRTLTTAHEEGLISDAEFQSKRNDLLKQM